MACSPPVPSIGFLRDDVRRGRTTEASCFPVPPPVVSSLEANKSGQPRSMNLREKILVLSIRHPRTIMAAVIVLVLGLGSQIPRIVIDTDPENMLPADQASRVFHNQVKRDFTLYDIIVVGVVNEKDPDGVFNPTSLRNIHQLTRGIERIDGVIRPDLLSISTVDNISQGGPGVVRFDWLMKDPPQTREEARAIRASAERLPTIRGTLLSEDGKAITVYVPIEEKNQSHRIATEIERKVAELDGDEEYFITGLPVAEDTFGVEMFLQMGIAAPLAGLIIFLLMWCFFRSVTLVLSPMIVAMATVIATMGLLIGLGFTVHIMSSMIPIFLMPIAVVDSVHILSEFVDPVPTREGSGTDHPLGDGESLYPHALHLAHLGRRIRLSRVRSHPSGSGVRLVRRLRNSAGFPAHYYLYSGFHRSHERRPHPKAATGAGEARTSPAGGVAHAARPQNAFRLEGRSGGNRRRACDQRHRDPADSDQRQPGTLGSAPIIASASPTGCSTRISVAPTMPSWF